MSTANVCRIILVEPSLIVAEGLKQLLYESYEFEVIEQMDNILHIKGRLLALHPDVLIINPSVLDYDKRFALRSLFQASPSMSLVALVYNYVPSDVLRQYNGIIEIGDTYNTIEATLHTAMTSRTDKKEPVENQDLTEREIDVLIAVAKGLMNKEIADRLSISIHTVISHRKNITRKIGIKSVSGLTVYALINNLIDKAEI
jgi:DNA-binding NarL/FixJ family response regulator